MDSPPSCLAIRAMSKFQHHSRFPKPKHVQAYRFPFVCFHCRNELGTKNFFERDGQPYCEPDYHHLFSPRCAYCNGPILDVRGTPIGRNSFVF